MSSRAIVSLAPTRIDGGPMQRRCIFAAVLAFAVALPLLAAGHSAAVFKKLQSLAGDWEGKDEHGMPAKTTFKVLISDTAVMETISPSGMEEMMTVYSVDGDGIALVHYCPTNNQPRMRALPGAGDLMRMELNFIFR